MPDQRTKNYVLLFISLILYVFIGYGIERYETAILFSAYGFLFLIYALICLNKEAQITYWLTAAVIFRISLLFCLPTLSDDFYRFIWDGRLLSEGYHPFAEIPLYYVEHTTTIPGITAQLFEKLNSKEYFTIYPPISQFIFWLSVKLSPGSIYVSVLIMKVIILTCEVGTLFIIPKILKHLKLPAKNILLYALNPLVIIELTGNIHFEGIMIFFLLLSIWLLIKTKLWQSAIVFALSICVKLLPLLFLPLLIKQIGWKKSFIFYAITISACIAFFIPLADLDIIYGFSHSISYYFQKFEFNASVYYLIRAFGYWFYGYNIIQAAGWLLGIIAIVIILVIAFFGKQSEEQNQMTDATFFIKMLLCLSTFFVFTTTLHPWYITLLLSISIFTHYRFVTVWTLLIFLTYAGYTANSFHENLLIIACEYIVVAGYFIYELKWKKNQIAF